MKTKEDHQKKIHSIVEAKGLCSMMNNTKWQELKTSVLGLPFEPPYILKRVDEEEQDYHQFENDVAWLGSWKSDLENYLGDDIYATPYYGIEWIKVRPRYLIPQGRLVSPKLVDETEAFIEILKRFHISYEENNGTFLIYGYK